MLIGNQDEINLHWSKLWRIGTGVVRAERAFLGFVSGRLEQIEDFIALVNLARLSPDLFAPPHQCLESWGNEFRDFLEDVRSWLLRDLDDPDSIESEMGDIDYVADALGADISELDAAAFERITELREEAAHEEDYDDDWRESQSAPQGPSDAEEVDAIFQSLLEG